MKRKVRFKKKGNNSLQNNWSLPERNINTKTGIF